jgi:hypothetical protein
MAGGVEAQPVSTKPPMDAARRVGRDSNQHTAGIQKASTGLQETNRVVNMLDNMAQYHCVERVISVWCRLQRPSMNGYTQITTHLDRSLWIHILPRHIPAQVMETPEPESTAASDIQ